MGGREGTPTGLLQDYRAPFERGLKHHATAQHSLNSARRSMARPTRRRGACQEKGGGGGACVCVLTGCRNSRIGKPVASHRTDHRTLRLSAAAA